MTPIPDDILTAATDITNRLPVAANTYATLHTIARAILAERKRCAEIARAFSTTTDQARAELVNTILKREDP